MAFTFQNLSPDALNSPAGAPRGLESLLATPCLGALRCNTALLAYRGQVRLGIVLKARWWSFLKAARALPALPTKKEGACGASWTKEKNS